MISATLLAGAANLFVSADHMTIITISRGVYSRGEEVAEKVGERLGYRILSHEVLGEAAEKYGIPLRKMAKAIHDAPTIFDRLAATKNKYIAYLAAELLERFKGNNVVYHGLAGHFFAVDISHHLRVRIVADQEERSALLMSRENLSPKQAMNFLRKEDRARQAWSRHFFKVDNTDYHLYDLVIHVHRLTVDHAVNVICEMAGQPEFEATPESQQALENLSLAAFVRAALMEDYPVYDVVADGSAVEIYVRFTLHSDTMITDQITQKVLGMPGVSSVSIVLIPGVLFT